MTDEQLLTPHQAAAFLNISVHTLSAWRTRDTPGRVPWHEVGGSIRYRQSDLELWLAAQKKNGTPA